MAASPDLLTVSKEVRTRFKDLVQSPLNIPAAFDNTLLVDKNGLKVGEAPPNPNVTPLWARATILWGDNRQITAGGRTVSQQFRRTCLFVVDLFLSAGRMDGDGLTTAQLVEDSFRNVDTGSIVWRTPSTTVVGRDGAWHHIKVQCPFRVDSIA